MFLQQGDLKVRYVDGRIHYSVYNGRSFKGDTSIPQNDYFVDALHEFYKKVGEDRQGNNIFREKVN